MMDLLPNYKNAYIALEKLRDYSLNENHNEGGHKAKVFKSALNIETKDASNLKNLILDGLQFNPVKSVKINDYGIIYSIIMRIDINEKTADITTAWIIKLGEDFPRLVSAYIKDK